MAFVRAMVQAYAARGLDPAAALEQAQIKTEDVDDSAARITATQMEVISGAAMRELDDEALGCFDRALPWGSYGLLARASLSSPTLGVALKRWCRHHGLLATDPLPMLEIEGDVARIAVRLQRDVGAMTELCVVSLLRNIHGLACWYVDSRIPLQGAQFPYMPPPHVDTYALLFDGPSLTVRSFRRDRLLVQRVRQVLATQPLDAHNADDLAVLLNLSARTLHRQLKEEGASLQALKDEVRRQRATELLLRTKRPIKQVAQATGFQNEKSFIRAFKTWTGKSPGEWRDKQVL
jgi:AraC-like DNA-binding protein